MHTEILAEGKTVECFLGLGYSLVHQYLFSALVPFWDSVPACMYTQMCKDFMENLLNKKNVFYNH